MNNNVIRFPIVAMLLLLSCGKEPSNGRGDLAIRPFFASAAEARQHVIGMILITNASPCTTTVLRAGSPPEEVKPDFRAAYAAAYLRTYQPRGGKPVDYILKYSAQRELEIAEGLYTHGFLPEAHFHYSNILTFYPNSPQAAFVKRHARKSECERTTGRTVRLTTADAKIYSRNFDKALADLKGINATSPTPETLFKEIACAVILREGSREEWLRRLRDLRKRHSSSSHAAEADYLLARLLADAEEFKEAKGILQPLARDKGARANLAAAYLLAELEIPRLTIEVPSDVVTTDLLPLKISARNITAVRFLFSKIDRIATPPPECASVDEARKYLGTALDTVRDKPLPPAFEETITIASEKSPAVATRELSLAVKAPGLYRVIAQARELRAVFFIHRPRDIIVESVVFPAGSLLRIAQSGNPLANATIWGSRQRLGTTAADGVAHLPSVIGQGICKEHRECCRTCESCLHHHGGDGKAVAGVFVASPEGFFHAATDANPEEVVKVKQPSRDPILMMYTDRPVYRAGDTIRFRGILRTPRETLTPGDTDRFKPLQETTVAVTIEKEKALLFRREYITGEFGAFAGEFTLPLSAHRQEYEMTVEMEKSRATRTIEVLDYRKSDFAILFTPRPGRLAVKAGYVWGDPVPGTRVVCRVNDGEIPATVGKDGLVIVPAKEGDTVAVALMRGDEQLVRQSAVFHEPKVARAQPTPPAEQPAVARPTESKSAPLPEQPPAAAPLFTVSPDRTLYGRGETVTLSLAAPWKEGEAWVILGDSHIYDGKYVRLSDGRATVTFPARGIHDPGTFANVVFKRGTEHQTERCPIAVAANRLAIDVRLPSERCRPGEEVDVAVKTSPGNAALSVGAVDEAIYMLRADDTPDLHATFYPKREGAFAYVAPFAISGDPIAWEQEPMEIAVKLEESIDPPFLGKGTYDMIEEERGAGAAGGRMSMTRHGGGVAGTSGAILATLSKLLSTQKPNGSWGDGVVPTEAGGISTVGTTGLSLLAFLGAGYHHGSKDIYNGICVGVAVQKGFGHLLGLQGTDGCIGPKTDDHLLNHAIAALALSEAYGLTASDLYRAPATRALEYLAAQQSPDGGWSRRGNDAGEILPSVVAVMALKSAQLSGIPYPATAAAMADGFLDRRVDRDGRCQAPSSNAADAGGALALLFLRNNRNDPRIRFGAARLSQTTPDKGNPDLLGIYLTTLLLFQFDGPSGPVWKNWEEPMKVVMLSHLQREGLRPNDLASVALTLEVYYRYASVFGGREGFGEDSLPLVASPTLRIHFPDTVLWIPELRTDAAGNATFPIKLPDAITTTRLTLRGVTREHQFGQTVARIATSRPFFVNLKCPEFFIAGDAAEIRAEVFNSTADNLKAAVRLAGDGFTPTGEERRTVDVPAGGSSSVSWRIAVGEASRTRLAVTAEAGTLSDGMVRTIVIHPKESERILLARGKSQSGGTFAFTLPENHRPRDLTLKVRPEDAPLAHILDALRYLNDYPHG